LNKRLLVAAVCAAALASPGIAAARPEPVAWCGSDEVADNRTPDLELSSIDDVRFVYAIPSDADDNFAAYVSGIATDAAWMEEWWRAQDPSRAPRFDRYPFPGCTSRLGQLDIGFVRLPRDSAYYRSSVFRRAADDMPDMPNGQKTIVYYDGPVSETRICGQSPSNPASGGRFGVSFVYLRSGCGLSPPGAGTSAVVATHELIHNLGALTFGAPDACPGDFGHPCDSAVDVLYPTVTPGATLDELTLDVNHDDYYAHRGVWFDVQDSRWLSHFPQYPLELSIVGTGTLFVRTTTGGLPCDTGCTGLTVDGDLHVVAFAVPGPGWQVGSWSGSCRGARVACTMTVAGAASATVTFVPATTKIVLRITGKGRVTSEPAGLACSTACSRSFPPEEKVRMTATPSRGWRFTGWTGACSGRGPCALSVPGGTVGARFVRR
jgi:hypothetical protein